MSTHYKYLPVAFARDGSYILEITGGFFVIGVLHSDGTEGD
jgi:hypothetical protein